MNPPLHPHCESLAFLLGTWRGTGAGEYPTIEAFTYNEEVTFGHVGKTFLTYTQKTRHAETGQPLHAEAGYLRCFDDDRIELVLVQPSGIIEMHSGKAEGTTLSLGLDLVRTTDTAVDVTDVVRSVRVHDDRLDYDISMAAAGQPLTHHLRAELHRADE